MPQQNRQTAYKVNISDLINGNFVKEEGWEPNYVVINNIHVSRVNIICVIVSKEFNESYQSIIVDDGTGRISVRSFDEKINFDDFEVGDVVLLIARLREFSKEKYLAPEIIRKIENKKWIELRKIELEKNKKQQKEIEKEVVIEGVIETDADKLLDIVRNLDNGDGANFEDVVQQVKDENIVYEMLKQGEIFEFRPGKLKVLE